MRGNGMGIAVGLVLLPLVLAWLAVRLVVGLLDWSWRLGVAIADAIDRRRLERMRADLLRRAAL